MFRHIALLSAVMLASGCSYDVTNSTTKTNNLEIKNHDKTSLNLNNLALQNVEKLSHEVTILGTICSAHTFKLGLASDLIEELQSIDKDGSLQSPIVPDIQIIISSAGSSVKCITTGLVSGKCQANISFSGKIVASNGKEEDLIVSKSAISSATACEGALTSLQMASFDVVNEILTRVSSFK
ncbi:MAG: hypothetical protein JKX94_03400 [Sneathiella sp.]|nr:hypothetical protein [Sneathiella sp.]